LWSTCVRPPIPERVGPRGLPVTGASQKDRHPVFLGPDLGGFSFHVLGPVFFPNQLAKAFQLAKLLVIAEQKRVRYLLAALIVLAAKFALDRQTRFLVQEKVNVGIPFVSDLDTDSRPVIDLEFSEGRQLIALALGIQRPKRQANRVVDILEGGVDVFGKFGNLVLQFDPTLGAIENDLFTQWIAIQIQFEVKTVLIGQLPITFLGKANRTADMDFAFALGGEGLELGQFRPAAQGSDGLVEQGLHFGLIIGPAGANGYQE
jgi:hypothetical protein